MEPLVLEEDGVDAQFFSFCGRFFFFFLLGRRPSNSPTPVCVCVCVCVFFYSRCTIGSAAISECLKKLKDP